jgi:hypothetical protein
MSSGDSASGTIHISFDWIVFGEDHFSSDFECQDIKWRDALLQNLDKTRISYRFHLIVNLLALELIQGSQINPIYIDIMRIEFDRVFVFDTFADSRL